MARHFQLVYPDGSKKHIGRAERDNLLLSGLAKQTGPHSYTFTGVSHTLHSFADLGSVSFAPEHIRRFLEGSFIVDRDGRRRRELMETPGALAYRLKLYPGQAEA